MSHPFFLNKGPISLFKIYQLLNIFNQKETDFNFFDIKDLYSANKDSITFFHSKKYEEVAKITKAKEKENPIKVNTVKAEGQKCPVCWKINKNGCERHSCSNKN